MPASQGLRTVFRTRDIVNVKEPQIGARGDGATSDTAALNAALALMEASTNADANPLIFCPRGVYVLDGDGVSSPNSASNFTIKGEGLDSTIFRWNGAAGKTMFKFTNARHVYLDDLSLYGKSTARPAIMVNFHRAAGGVIGAGVGMSGMRRVRIGDGTSDHDCGVKYSADVGQDSNNEQGTFEDVEIIGSQTYAYHFAHSNSLLHRILRGNMAYYVLAAVNNDCGGAENASFDIDGSTFAGNTGSVIFLLAKPRYPVNVTNCYHENDAATNTKVVAMVGDWVGGQSLNFYGGAYAMGDPATGADYNFDFQATDGLSSVNFYNSAIYSPNGVNIRLRGNGSVVNFFGGAQSWAKLEYSAEVNIIYTKQGSGGPTYTNLGGGVLNVRARSKGANSKNIMTALTALSAGAISADGHSGDPILITLAAPDTLTDILNGVVGQRITIVAGNGNLTIAHDGSFTANKIFLRGRMNRTLRRLDSITLDRWDSTSGGGEWIESANNTHAVQLSGSNVVVGSTGNVGAGTDDLMSFSLPANALDTDSGQGARGVRISASGTTANNANAKTVTLNWGGTVLSTLALTAGQLSPWAIEAEVYWSAEDTQRFWSRITQGGTAKQTDTASNTAAENDDAAITIKCTGTATTDNDIVQHTLKVELIR